MRGPSPAPGEGRCGKLEPLPKGPKKGTTYWNHLANPRRSDSLSRGEPERGYETWARTKPMRQSFGRDGVEFSVIGVYCGQTWGKLRESG